MNIVIGEDRAIGLAARYIVLTLDTFRVDAQTDPVKSFCVIETVPIDQLAQIEHWQDLHENLIVNYGKKNWDYCLQAIEHLMGRWNGQVDSFYVNLAARITTQMNRAADDTWSPIIDRVATDTSSVSFHAD